MPYCKKCGAELPEYAVFCTKCGLKYPVSGAVEDDDYAAPPQSTAPVAEQTSVTQHSESSPQPAAHADPSAKPVSAGINSEWFKNHSLTLYIILGVVSIVLLQFCTQIAYSSFGFSVVLGVFAILCAIAYCAVGVMRYVISGKASGKKQTTCDNVCLALGIIGLIYVLFMTIAVLKAAGDLQDAAQLFGSLFG